MDIIYLLTNTSKKPGETRFYIGSKSECCLQDIDGIPTIIDLKTSKPYMGSSSNKIMQNELRNQQKFKAEILAIVDSKSDLVTEENNYLLLHNAVESEEYYNLSLAYIGRNRKINSEKIINIYGETVQEYSVNKRNISKKNNRAVSLGFKNMGELSIDIYKRYLKGESHKTISLSLGSQRKFSHTYIKEYDMDKCLLELSSDLSKQKIEIRKMVINGASIKKVAEIFELEIPTVSILLGDVGLYKDREFKAATRIGISKEELENKIVQSLISGKSYKDTALELAINQTTVRRYIIRFLKRRFKINDFE